MKKHYFTKFEVCLWSVSSLLVAGAFIVSGGSPLLLIASLIGVTSLIFAAKGNPVSPGLMIVFSLIYGYISFGFRYYGEMLTYVGMTMPMSVTALVSWLRNPYKGNRSQVAVGKLSKREYWLMPLLTAAVTAIFYYILKYTGTMNLLPSTLSVTTSFAAVYLTFRRSPYFALAYACNDAVLIILWGLASLSDRSYVPMLICFTVFLVNDVYGFLSWRKMAAAQSEDK